jgi:hypothetical protein
MTDSTEQWIILERGFLDQWFARWPPGATSVVASRELIRDMVDAMNRSERLQKERRWIPVEERLPEKSVYVAALWAGLPEASSPGEKVLVVRRGVPGWYLQNGVEMTAPTHWTPLPAPPGVK